MLGSSSNDLSLAIIQGPHCLYDIQVEDDHLKQASMDQMLNVLDELVTTLGMKQACDPRIFRMGTDKISIYQIISTSHIILHLDGSILNADLFSCEPFDVGAATETMIHAFGDRVIIQYCQRNLIRPIEETKPIPMGNLNTLTANPLTLTHALINWYGGDEQLLGDVEYGTSVLKKASGTILSKNEELPPSAVILLDVEPILSSWDKGGFSGGYVNIRKQLTMHTFLGINAAFTDVMGDVYDIEQVIRIVREGFKFDYYEVDAIYQRYDRISRND